MLADSAMNWKRDTRVVWRQVKAMLFAGKKAFYWIKDKLGMSEEGMAALVTLTTMVIGLLIGYFFF